MYWQFEEKPVSIRVERVSGCNQFGWVRLLSQRSRQEMVTVPPCGTFCIGLCVTLCHLVGHFVLDCVTLCHLVGHFILDSVLHCATLWGTLYWTLCYTVPPCGALCTGLYVTPCCLFGTLCIGLCV